MPNILANTLVDLVPEEWGGWDGRPVLHYMRDKLTPHKCGTEVKYKDIGQVARYRCSHINPDYDTEMIAWKSR